MSFRSDAAALSALVTAILERGYCIKVMSEGDALCQPSRSFLTISVAVHSVTDDCFLLLINGEGKRAGWFRILLQDDPDCLVVDYGQNAVTDAIWDQWSKVGGVV